RSYLYQSSDSVLDQKLVRSAVWIRRIRDLWIRISADGKCARGSDRLDDNLLVRPPPTAAVISAKFLDVCGKNRCRERSETRALLGGKRLEEQRVRRQEQGRARRWLHQAGVPRYR